MGLYWKRGSCTNSKTEQNICLVEAKTLNPREERIWELGFKLSINFEEIRKRRQHHHVPRNVHAQARQSCGIEAAEISRRHVRCLGCRRSSHPLHSSLAQRREGRAQARALGFSLLSLSYSSSASAGLMWRKRCLGLKQFMGIKIQCNAKNH
ncbi:hypothetical protein PIB30_010985 [Stylosanthes scabra]|uniref:Uncharacterized protein n=1 Tax=Stylosanthes scabra TaxID=79078 RepID=A0ABU6V4M0_9FABA|nr:hypothetical protein [Stylosanthes scabra]